MISLTNTKPEGNWCNRRPKQKQTKSEDRDLPRGLVKNSGFPELSGAATHQVIMCSSCDDCVLLKKEKKTTFFLFFSLLCGD